MQRRAWLYPLLLGAACQRALAAPDVGQEALLEVTINGEPQSAWSLIELSATGAAYARKADLTRWGVQLAEDSSAARASPDTLISLNDVPGMQATVDRAASRLTVEVQPALLRSHEFRSAQAAPRPTPSPLGVFLNYDVDAAQNDGAGALRAATELGVVRGDWVARSSWLGTSQSGHTEDLRLDSNVTADDPATRTSLQGGDTFARLGANSESVRIGGVSWGTDFSVTPTFITVPLPSVSALTATSGTADLYVNGAKTQQLNVPGGPFVIAQIPVPTGAGELTVVTHDLLGRSQTVTQTYYVSPQMLQSGLSAWDIEFGSKREDYGLLNDDYSGWLAAGGERIGVSDRLTAQWRVEADETGAALSGAWFALTPNQSLVSLSASCSSISGDVGCLVDTAFEHDRTVTGYGLDVSYATAGYVPVAAAERVLPPRWQMLAHAQANSPGGLDAMVGATWRQELNCAHTLNLNLTVGKTWSAGGHIDLTVSRIRGSADSTFLNLVYTQSIGRRSSVSAASYANNGQWGNSVAVQQNLPAGEGYGYTLRAARDSVSSTDASVQWNGDVVAMAATAQREGNQTALNADISGAAVWLGDEVLAARHLDRSFAVIHAAGLPDVTIYENEQPVTRTDAHGAAVVPDLRPFESNSLALDPTTLPLSLDVPQTRFEVIPYRRGGAYIDVRVQLAASVRLRLPGGEFVPAGAAVHVGSASAPVGIGGMAYVEGRAGDNLLRVEWDGGVCHAHLDLPAPPARDAVDDSVELRCIADR